VGGRPLLRLNTDKTQIENNYCEENMKRSLKESQRLEIAEEEAVGILEELAVL
jgi:hypothetical protein